MFKLEYLSDDDCEDCPLIRLYSFETIDVKSLHELCRSLADGRLHEVQLDKQPWVQAIGETRLMLRLGKINREAHWSGMSQCHVMECNREGWLAVAEKVAPFIDQPGGYQWLNDGGEVNVLISKNGLW